MIVMRIHVFVALLCVLAIGQEIPANRQAPPMDGKMASEPVPGLLCMDEVRFDGRDLAIGMSRDQVIRTLGDDIKVSQKPKRYTASKLASEADTIQRFAPMYPRMVDLARKAAIDCGAECWIEGVSKQLPGKDSIRVSLIGTNRTDLKVYMIVFDRGGAAIRNWRSQHLSDLRRDARYFVTDDGTYRVSRDGRVYTIEKVK